MASGYLNPSRVPLQRLAELPIGQRGHQDVLMRAVTHLDDRIGKTWRFSWVSQGLKQWLVKHGKTLLGETLVIETFTRCFFKQWLKRSHIFGWLMMVYARKNLHRKLSKSREKEKKTCGRASGTQAFFGPMDGERRIIWHHMATWIASS